MTYTYANSRKAMTAIAAVLAFSSTPLLAQDVTAPDPVADTAVETPPPAADPLAPEEVAPAATTATEAAPAKAAPKPKASVTKRVTTTTTTTKTVRPIRATAAPVAAPPVEPATPVPAPEAMAPLPTPIAPTIEPAPADQANVMDDVLPVAGGTALGLLAIAGAAMAMRRRKRREEDEEFVERQTVLAKAEPAAAVAEPAFARTPQPVHDPIPTDAPVTELPAEFDLSRFGRHVQAAYRGPTADNPSLSLKNRLRRASFYDQQERKAAEVAAEKRVADLPKARDNAGSDFMLRRAGTRVPAYQH